MFSCEACGNNTTCVCRCITLQCEVCGNDKLGGPLSDRAHVQHALCCHFVLGRNTAVVRRVLFKSTSNPMIPSEQSLYFFLRPLETVSRNDCDGLSNNFIWVECSVVSSRKGSVK